MIGSLLSNVHILSFEDLSKDQLLHILSFAAGKREDLNVAIVCDKAPIPRRDELINELKESCSVSIFDTVRPNPLCTDIMEMYATGKFETADIILSIGGGSVLDSAKALAMLTTNKGSLEDYLGNTPSRKITEKNLPLVLIPTTAGTGSEVTKVGVYTDPKGRKYTLGSPLMHAHTALLVGSFLDSIPASLCASTGLDALDHALESIWNKNATAITRLAAEQAAIEVLTTLPKLYRAIVEKKEDRKELQKQMLNASCLAGISFNITGTASGHAISFILSEEWHVPHGAACAFTLLEVFDWACQEKQNRSSLARISSHFNPEISDETKLIETLRSTIASLIAEMKVPQTFTDLGVSLEKQEIEATFERSFTDPKMLNQLPPMREKPLYEMLGKKL
ncbi:alcohol dehydrogenase, class IV [Sphaerochaeta pleomorpha str. Grapes]|uniref:Alcohol dehydrogenase, class IV n=1 Tax=Sphaerochaeta pleomorpha (strain ATCC BAA-1885 / DSM 22778 / Grapes) TaxID=158190 RepID=G8QU38_SPHPG|nr:iron-containing alcohol dehydrogenase [Sphaerochaeta pleomorpha]AEV30285.1 alcohol dehydrogenase, class IV [Sphaerochaeta pleomorpha str. Grapes]